MITLRSQRTVIDFTYVYNLIKTWSNYIRVPKIYVLNWRIFLGCVLCQNSTRTSEVYQTLSKIRFDLLLGY